MKIKCTENFQWNQIDWWGRWNRKNWSLSAIEHNLIVNGRTCF